MSISFSGLASGLDTSSWVESLVALKQAKVNTLQQEKENVVLSRDTLNSIKSFFASFRSTIEKITDSRFNIVSMDLFAQNLATSANLDVLTATATSEAVEGTYRVKVDKLASNTNAISNYKTIVQTTTVATADSYLRDIGVGTGTIGVTKDGIKYGISITNSDTIATFIDKLREIGVEADYNEVTGRFNMNISASDIDDSISNTNIVDRLHLEGVNEGYKTVDKLQIETVTTEWDKATSGTLLSALGVHTGSATDILTINANGANYDITLEADDTIGDLVAALKANNIDADFLAEEGIFVLADATITSDGTTNFITEMGLTQEIYSKSQATKLLLHETVVVQTTVANSGTLIRDLAAGSAIQDGQNVIVKNSNNEYTTISVGTGTSIGDLLTAMSNAGLYAAINNDGTIEISGGSITGGSFNAISALGLQTEPYTAMTTGTPLTETVIEYDLVSLQTRLVEDLGVTKGYLEVTDSEGNKYYEKIYAGQTIADFMADMGNLGIYTKLDENTGVLEITGGAFRTLDNINDEVGSLIANGTIHETEAAYQQGTNLLQCLYGSDTISTEQITVASTYARTRALTQSVTNLVDATLSSTLGTLGLNDDGTAIFNARGETVTIDLTSGMTIQNLIDTLAANGIESSWDSDFARITINNATLEGGTSNLADVLNLTTEISGKYVTSDALSSQTTITIDASRDTLFSDLGVNSNEEVVLMKEDGTCTTFNVSGTTTMGNFIDTLNANGVTAKIENGVFSIDGGYITNTAIEEALGLEHAVMGYSNILGNQLTHTIITTATGSTTVGNIITALGTSSAVAGGYDIAFNSTSLSVSADTTIDELMSQIYALGGTSSIDSSGRLHIHGGTLSGTVATALGFQSITTTDSVASTGETLSVLTTVFADETTQLSALGYGESTISVMGSNGSTIGTITTSADMTIGEIFDELANLGVSATISNGVIRLASNDGRYATGGVLSSMGIGISDNVSTKTIGGTNTSTDIVSTTYTITADSSTTLGELGYGTSSVITVNGVDGITLGTITTNADMTLGDMLTAFAGYGISGTITDGVINLNSSNGSYVTGDLMTAMGIGASSTTHTTTAGLTATSNGALTYTKTTGSSNTSSEGVDYNATVGTGATSSTNIIATTTVGSSNTSSEGVDYNATVGTGATSSTNIVATTTVGSSNTSSEGVDYNATVGTGATSSTNIVATTTVGSSNTSSEGVDYNATVGTEATSSTNIVATTTVGGGNTSSDVVDYNATVGTGATSSTNIIATTTVGGANTSSDVVDYNATVGTSQTSTNTVFVSTSIYADSATTLGELGYTVASEITVSGPDGVVLGTVTTSASMTIGEMLSAFAGYGISGTITDGIIRLNSPSGNYVTGDVITGMGITTNSSNYTSTAGVANTSTENVTYTDVVSNVEMISTFTTVTTTAQLTLTEAVVGSETITVQHTITSQVTTTDPWIVTVDRSSFTERLSNLGVQDGDVLYFDIYNTSSDQYVNTFSINIDSSMLNLSTKEFLGDYISEINHNTINGVYCIDTRYSGNYYVFNGETAEALGLVNYTVHTIEPGSTSTSETEIVTTIVSESTQPVMITVPVMGTVPVTQTFTYSDHYEITSLDEYTCRNRTFANLGYSASSIMFDKRNLLDGTSEEIDLVELCHNDHGIDITRDCTIAEAMDLIAQSLMNIGYDGFSYNFDLGYLYIHQSKAVEGRGDWGVFGSDFKYFLGDNFDCQVIDASVTLQTGTTVTQTGTTVIQDSTTTLVTSTVTTTEHTTEVQTFTVSDTLTVVSERLATEDTYISAILKHQAQGVRLPQEITITEVRDGTGPRRTYTVSISETDTVGDFVATINSIARGCASFNAETGIITIDSDARAGVHYILDGALAEALGFQDITYTVQSIPASTTTVGATATSTAAITYTDEVNVGNNITTDALAKYNKTVGATIVSSFTAGQSSPISLLNRTMSALGATTEASRTIKGYYYGEIFTIKLEETDTLQTLKDRLAEYDINLLEYRDTSLGVPVFRYSLICSENSYISSGLTALASRFGWYKDDGSTISSAYTTISKFVDDNSTFRELGATSQKTMHVVKDGTTYFLTFKSSDTIGYMKEVLSDLGIEVSIEPPAFYDGVEGVKIRFNTTPGSYIMNISDNLKQKLKITTSDYYQTITQTINATSTTEFANLGLAAGNQTISVVSNGTTYTFTLQENNTIGDLLVGLAGYGISGTVNNGTVRIVGTEDAYISGMSANLASILNLNTANFSTTSTIAATTTVLYDNHTQQSRLLHYNEYQTHTITDTFTATVITGTTNVTHTIVATIVEPMTTTSPVTTLVTTTIPASEVTIPSITFTVFDAQTYWTQITTSTQITVDSVTTTVNTIDTQLEIQVQTSTLTTTMTTVTDAIMTTATRFNQLGISSNQELVVVSNGEEYTITVEAGDTVNDLISTLAGLGITGYVNNGRLTLEGDDDAYIKSITNDLESALKLADDANNYITTGHTTTSNDESNELSTGSANAILNAGMTFGQLGIAEADRLISVVHNGETHTFSMQASDTIGDLFNYLAGVGITGSITDGKITLTGDGNSYISSMSENLKNRFNLAGATFSTLQAQELTTDTRLNQLGVNSNQNIVVVNNGIEHTITVEATDSVDDIISTLAGLGITGSVTDGKLTLQGNENAYIKSIDDGLESALKLSADATNYNAVSGNILSSTTFDSLGIAEADRLISVVHNGETHTFSMQASDTIGDMFNYLAGVGITGSITDGKITLTGDGNSYISSMSENLKNRFNLAGATFSTLQAQELTTDTRLNQLGVSSNQNIVVVNNGIEHTITVEATDSVDDIISTLAGLGITGSVTDGKLTLQGNENAYIKSIDDGLESALKLSADATNYNAVTGNILSSTTFDSLGIADADRLISVVHNGETHTFSMQASDTIGDMFNYLAGVGITGSITDGVITLTGDGNSYISSMSENLKNRFNMSSAVFSTEQAQTLTTDTRLNQLGVNSNQNIVVVNNGIEHTITVEATDSVDDIISTLAGLGITGSVTDGKLTLTGSENAYIKSIDDGLESALKLSADATNYNINTGVQITGNTRFVELGATATGTISVVSNGNTYTVTVEASDTVDDMLTSLAGLGIYGSIENGVLTLQGDNEAYIQSTANLDYLNLNNNFYTTTEHATYSNDSSDNQSYETTNVLTTDDTFARHGLTSSDTINIVSNDIETIVTVHADDTIDDFISTLAGLGISSSVHDGKISLQGGANSYISSVGNNIKDVLNLSDSLSFTTITQTITSNTSSDQLESIIRGTATGASELQHLRHEDDSSLSGYDLILQTTSDAGNEFVTLTFSATDSLHDVIDTLAQHGLNAYVDSAGRFGVYSSTLTDFDISGALGDFLMGSYTKIYDQGRVNSVSTNLIQQTVVNMDDSTQLSKLNITSGNLLLYQDGTTYTLTIDNTQNIGDFRNLLAEYGIASEVINGRLQLQADGVVYIDSIAGGSNLAQVMGIEHGGWDMGDYSQESKNLFDKQTITHSATMNDKISELTDGAGNNLGVSAGQIYVYQDGTRNVININTNDTLQDLANKLSQYGISMDISSDGKIYFNGNNNSYLTTDGIASGSASNILTKFNVSNNWETRYNSTSETLDYEQQDDVMVDGNTKLVDLKDNSGNSLGITEGNYYVYQNGVRNTESISSDTTVNDFLSTMALYGISTDFDQNGSLSLGGYNETYLATAATGGDNTNAIDVLFESWNFVNIYTSNDLDIPTSVTVAITETTKLSDINEGAYQAGYITVVKDGVQTDIELTADDTVGNLMDELALYGFESVINGNGQLIIKNTGDSLLQTYNGAGTASNALQLLGIDLNNWVTTNSYESGTINVVSTTTETISADRSTLLSEMGVSTGEYYVWNNGVKYTAFISSDETLGSFIDTLRGFGLETSFVDTGAGSRLSLEGSGDAYITSSNSTDNKSNVVEVLFTNPVSQNYIYQGVQETSRLVTTYSNATEDTLLSHYDSGLLLAEGNLSVNIDGVDTVIQVEVDDTIGSLLNKFRALGMEASLADGHIIIQSGYKDMTINVDGTTSNLLATLNMTFRNDLGGYISSADEIEQTVAEEKVISVSNYADFNTQMKLLNISDGTLSVYRNGEKATINIDSEQTFGALSFSLLDRFGDVNIRIDENTGYLEFYSTDPNVSVEVGSTTDTSNFSAITGVSSSGNGTARSARELYCVNSSSVITTAGIFRNGNVVEGTFFIGDEEFTIDDTTTLSSLISQINVSERANATAYWDSVDGKFVIKSRTTGAALVNIEAGTSNFTDIMGFTKSEWADADSDGTPDIGESTATVTRMNIEAQEVGDNARFSINGTYYTSTSNTISSDVSRIQGLTINLKGISEGETTLTVERDKETVANAVSDIVDAYNELIENVDKEVAKGSPLDDQSTLKFLRNQIRSLMTSSLYGTGVFKNLDAIGISLDAATSGNIRTDNINVLTFDKNKFLDAFDADRESLKSLLVGTDANLGIFQRVESVIETAISANSGFFTSAEMSYNKQISNLDNKIEKAKKAVERYRERLEAKFASMDLLISNMQNQYSSFLGF